MTVVFRALIAVAVALPISSLLAAPSEGVETRYKTEFAVVPAMPASTDASNDWLPQGVAFDLEKRLGRLPTLEAADHLEVTKALQHAGNDDSSRVRAVMSKTGARLVLCVSALSKGGPGRYVQVEPCRRIRESHRHSEAIIAQQPIRNRAGVRVLDCLFLPPRNALARKTEIKLSASP